MAAPRPVIVHHHIFKCAGTSLDRLLERAFPGRLGHAEPRTRADAQGWIAATPELAAYSSHHAPLGLAVEGVRILPVVFVREPLARIVSAYRFERQQGQAGHTGPGAQLAAAHDLAGWLRHRLDWPNDRQVRNLQAHRLATWRNAERPDPADALAALDALPFVGLVEAFEASLDALRSLAADAGLHLAPGTARANATGSGAAAEEAVAALPRALRDELVAANAHDCALHEAVAARFSARRQRPLGTLAS